MMNRRSVQTNASVEHDVAAIAENLRSDFVALTAVLDRHLTMGGSCYDCAMARLSDARAAAERGLRLSEQLVELLHSTS